jgi:hypothetical protein
MVLNICGYVLGYSQSIDAVIALSMIGAWIAAIDFQEQIWQNNA